MTILNNNHSMYMFGLSLLLSVFSRAHILFAFFFCLLADSCVQRMICFIFRRLVCPTLPVSLDCIFLIAPSVFSSVYLSNASLAYSRTQITIRAVDLFCRQTYCVY